MASEAEKTFQRFAVFGESSSSGTEMNNKNFSKLCKDCGIMDGKAVTSTDVDIVFSKVKAKNARTITFSEFQEAMKELGQKRFKGKNPDEALQAVFELMEGKDPATTGVTYCGLNPRLVKCSTTELHPQPEVCAWKTSPIVISKKVRIKPTKTGGSSGSFRPLKTALNGSQ
ncbi:tubulin polymerization-promoting protein family member 2 isoform X1 [Ictidomys tridecemlineatus]